MRDWLRLFSDKDAVLTYEIENEGVTQRYSFSGNDCEFLTEGHSKRVYKIKKPAQPDEPELCIFLPKCLDEDEWNNLINYEKSILDRMIKNGLRAQKFEIVALTVSSKNRSAKINVLLTDEFNSLCAKESLIIYDRKGIHNMVFGRPYPFYANRMKFRDIAYAQGMLEQFVKDYATAFTYSYPITVLIHPDDSEHYCFEIPRADNTDAPPRVRYMFWDTAHDFVNRTPTVPTLKQLKEGLRNCNPLLLLANNIACAIREISRKEMLDALGENGAYREGDLFIKEIETHLLTALNDDAFLMQGLVHAKQLIGDQLRSMLATKNWTQGSILHFKSEMMYPIISTGNLELVKKYLGLSAVSAFSDANFTPVIEFARKYDNKDIIHYLELFHRSAFDMDKPLISASSRCLFLATPEVSANTALAASEPEREAEVEPSCRLV